MAKDKAPARQFLSRADMEQTIKSGGSVIHQGEHITDVANLPSDVDLAVGDPAAEAAQMNTIDRQIEALEKDKARLARVHADRARTMAAREAADEEDRPRKPGRPRKAAAARRRGARADARADAESATRPTASAGDAGDSAKE